MRTLGLCCAFLITSSLRADEAELFGKVRPILESACFKCHSHAANKSKGDLVVDSRSALIKGGESGAAIVPGDLDKSLLIKAIRYVDDDLRMPPAGKLSADQVAILSEWVKAGAPWPGEQEKVASKHSPGKISDEDRKWWAFQPLQSVAPPKVDNPLWKVNPVDRFLFARLQAEGLKPSQSADRLTLLRRVFFDLTGLPPTQKDVEAFLADTSPDAYERLVDRLLASPRYGEKWARHWLDLVRYSESDGYRIDDYRPNAWRYRDYVIRAFNADKPYDRFLHEQLAGDELFPGDPEALIGTGYLRHWIYEYNQRDVRSQWQSILDDVTDVTGEAILGLGLGCARCHDHKFDPLLQKDFYRLQAFFAGIQPNDYEVFATAEQRRAHREEMDAWTAKGKEILDQIETLTKAERKSAENGAIKKFEGDIQKMLRKPEAERSPFEKQIAALAYRQVTYEFDRLENKKDKNEKLAALHEELVKVAGPKPKPLPVGLAVRDVGPEAPPISIPKKSRGEPIAPGYLTILDPNPADIVPALNGDSTGRRSTLAKWLTRTDHPLTARVFVNRVWQQHFGQGIVNTPSDFGKLGEKPSHPESLDWLASNFVAEGWSVKKLHRQILTSQAYRQSATQPASEMALRKDPQNRLLWRMSTRRLQAEQIRDAILTVTGKLDLSEGGPGVESSVPRRSIYTKQMRNSRDPLMEVFDVPEGVASVGLRNVTTTPTQALLLINGPFMIAQAKAMANRIEETGDGPTRVEAAFRLAFGRTPTPQEVQQSLAFIAEQSARAGRSDAAWVDFCQVLLNANEFVYID